MVKVWELGIDFETFSLLDVGLDLEFPGLGGDSGCLSLLDSDTIRERRDRLEGADDDSGEVEKLAMLRDSRLLLAFAWTCDKEAAEEEVVSSQCVSLEGDFGLLGLVELSGLGWVIGFAGNREKKELNHKNIVIK